MLQYATLKKEHVTENEWENMEDLCKKLNVCGTEVFMDDICSRSELLYYSEREKEEVLNLLKKLCVKRVHCSYWAYPTSFLAKNRFSELIERFGGEKAVKSYYGDLTGKHMYDRWMQEYEIATDLNAQSYTFHLIDYAPIDGRWKFTISRNDINQAMVYMIQTFINLLMDRNLMTKDSPQIEIENAGFGLEFGIQTADDYDFLFSQLYDPYQKVKIGWDINHLLHALGWCENKKRAGFYLPEDEINDKMKKIEAECDKDGSDLVMRWIESNVLCPSTVGRVGSIQLSDCVMKKVEYFTKGKFNEPYFSHMINLESWDAKEEYGVDIVLEHYDSHVILGQGGLVPEKVREMLYKVQVHSPEVVILHELKNHTKMSEAVLRQKELLNIDE